MACFCADDRFQGLNALLEKRVAERILGDIHNSGQHLLNGNLELCHEVL